jgi:hypothetical protein
LVRNVEGQGNQEVIVGREDFKSADGKKLEWSKVATFEITIVDRASRAKLDLTTKDGHAVLRSIQLVD